MTTLSDLLRAPTREDMLDMLLGLARLAGFPVAAWQSGSVPRTLFEVEAHFLAEVSEAILGIAKGGFLDLADGPWLTLLARSLFNEDRKPAVFTQGSLTLTDFAGAGPYTVTPGAFWVATGDKTRRYFAVTGGTLPASGTLTITVQAESPGADFNVAPFTLTEQVTPFPGVRVSNGVGWITRQGADEEKDGALRQRCRDKWSTLGSGSNAAAYRYWASSASPEITRTRVDSDPTTGIVSVTVAGPSGPVSVAALTAAREIAERKRPLTVRANVSNAGEFLQKVTSRILMDAGAPTGSTLDAVRSAVDTYARQTEIGDTIIRSKIIAAIEGVPGVRSVRLLEPKRHTVMPPSYVFVPVHDVVLQ